MADETADQPDEGGDQTPEAGQPADLGDPGKKALDAERARARDADKRAKAAEKELDQLRQSHLSDQEKAIVQAKADAKAEAYAEVGSKIAAAEFKAAVAGRLDDGQMATLLSGLDLKAFLDDAGDVDPAKVKSFVDTVAPVPVEPPADKVLDPLAGLNQAQGARSAPALNSTQLERDLVAKINGG